MGVFRFMFRQMSLQMSQEIRRQSLTFRNQEGSICASSLLSGRLAEARTLKSR